MYEWLFLRLLMLGAMVGGGVVLALAGTALDKWRARRAAVNCTRESDANTAKHCGNLTEFDRLREQRARVSLGADFMDFVFVGLIVGFFAITVGLVHFCSTLMGKGGRQ